MTKRRIAHVLDTLITIRDSEESGLETSLERSSVVSPAMENKQERGKASRGLAREGGVHCLRGKVKRGRPSPYQADAEDHQPSD
jgi:hypothetical protein